MYLGKKILVVIPARGGSKGIPGKNLRLLDNKPLLSYAINIAKSSIYADDIAVSSEDERILEVASHLNAAIVRRPSCLSKDDITLDPVIFHAVEKMEERSGSPYDVVITLQPTSPLLLPETLDKAIRLLINKKLDTVISALPYNHLLWRQNAAGKFTPLFKERKNRQFLTGLYKEAGAFLATKRPCLSEKSRIGKRIWLLPLSEKEGIDIDHFSDWWIAENYLCQPRVGFRVDGDHDIGLGHVYRALTIAYKIFNSGIVFFVPQGKKMVIDKIKEHHYPVIEFTDEMDIVGIAAARGIDIMINDFLDTSDRYIASLRKANIYVVNFEDLGEGGELAHLVINALYENSHYSPKYCYGYKYVCLRDEFYRYPYADIRPKVSNILLMFGGVDKNNLTLRCLKAIEKNNEKQVNVNAIVGLGYKNLKGLAAYANQLAKKGFNINIRQNINSVARHIAESDLVITSNGRTIYEVSSLGVPCISISQNDREARHLFSYYSKCIKNLGLAATVTESEIAKAILDLIGDYEARKKINIRLRRYDLQSGTERIVSKIFEGHQRWKQKGASCKKSFQ